MKLFLEIKDKNISSHNSVEMPMLGYGVYHISDLTECKCAVVDALDAGYGLSDTAAS